MQITTILPALSALCLMAFLLITALNRSMKATWVFPAILAALFMVFSLYTVIQEGLWAFWPNHSQSLWGNQVWVDLLLAIGIAWAFILPEARRLNMALIPWLVIIPLTGCIGLLAMVARLLWLRDHESAQERAPHGRPS